MFLCREKLKERIAFRINVLDPIAGYILFLHMLMAIFECLFITPVGARLAREDGVSVTIIID
ncbi:hypothetical protein BK665_18780 [Pseudomonas frederiksbergensis]|uniref:Uncharacterized protein n=1 Tax=Pseudomonas frederiksbergensis TaxID=104087 RepID=A0A423KGF3_9PSED|nr:hypothetical protein BK665_18780 [Pseudomonas frederiksbergensis]